MDSNKEWYVIKNEKKPAWNQLHDQTGLRDEDKGQVTPFDFHESKPVEYYLHMIGHIPWILIILLKLTNHSDYADQLFRYPWSTNIVLNILIIRTNYSDESDQ